LCAEARVHGIVAARNHNRLKWKTAVVQNPNGILQIANTWTADDEHPCLLLCAMCAVCRKLRVVEGTPISSRVRLRVWLDTRAAAAHQSDYFGR
jgi:hypothetical protein